MLSAEELLADTKNDTVMPLSERFSPDLLWEKLVKDVRENTNLFSIPDLMTEGVPLKLEYSTLTVAFDEDYGDIAYQSVIKEKDLPTEQQPVSHQPEVQTAETRLFFPLPPGEPFPFQGPAQAESEGEPAGTVSSV